MVHLRMAKIEDISLSNVSHSPVMLTHLLHNLDRNAMTTNKVSKGVRSRRVASNDEVNHPRVSNDAGNRLRVISTKAKDTARGRRGSLTGSRLAPLVVQG